MKHHKPNKQLASTLVVIILTGFAAFAALIYSHAQDSAPNSGDIGAWAACTLAVLFVLVPIGYVKVFDVKVNHPRPLYVDPKPVTLLLQCAAGSVVAGVVILAITGLLFSSPLITNAAQPVDTFLGSFTIGFGIFFVLYAPIVGWWLFTRLRYEKVIEYSSPEWEKYSKLAREAKRRKKIERRLPVTASAPSIPTARRRMSRKKTGYLIIFSPILLLLVVGGVVTAVAVVTPHSLSTGETSLVSIPILDTLLVTLAVVSFISFVPCVVIGIILIVKERNHKKAMEARP